MCPGVPTEVAVWWLCVGGRYYVEDEEEVSEEGVDLPEARPQPILGWAQRLWEGRAVREREDPDDVTVWHFQA